MLQRPNGRVSPLEEGEVYPVSRFEGRQLKWDPIPENQMLGLLTKTRRPYLPIQNKNFPSNHLQLGRFLSESLNVRPYNDSYYEIEDVFGIGKHGYIEQEHIVVWNEQPPPEEIEEDEIGLISILKSNLALRQGRNTLFVTLISSAKEEFETPTGLFRIYKKAEMWDLASKPDADEQYFIESVPWVMHYYPRYAIHTAFWHADFGIPSSHGCINMSPRDVQLVFDAVTRTYRRLETCGTLFREDGTLIRIRRAKIRMYQTDYSKVRR